jgi:MSHA pilin protein MshD
VTRARGFTLIEIVVSIVVMGIALTAVLGMLSSVAARSGAALVQAQATEIASAYLNEILLRPVVDPDGIPVEASRSLYDDVGDYNGLTDVGAHDQFNQPIPSLTNFNVAVRVTTPPAGALGAIPPASMREIDVTVVHSSGVTVVLTGYRTAH